MNVWKESKNGVLFSMLSPLALSILPALDVAFNEAITSSIIDFIGATISIYFLFVVVSGVISTVACILVGIPVYYVLKKVGAVNPLLISGIGGLVAFLCSLSGVNSLFMTSWFVSYGVFSGFLFWYGATHVGKKL